MKRKKLTIDLETRSRLDLKKVGADRYAEEAQIIVMACKEDDEETEWWDIREVPKGNPAVELYRKAWKDSWIIEAHNAPFEVAMLYNQSHTLGIPAPRLENIHCSAARCRMAAIPHSLAGASKYLQLEHGKMEEGKRLIQIFCKPNATGGFNDWTTPGGVTILGKKYTYEEAWELLVDYCVADVDVEHEISEMLSLFPLRGTDLESFQLDLKMNRRGVPINLDSLRHVNEMVEDVTEEETEKFRKITGLGPTQREKVQKWLQKEGYQHDNMQEATITEALESDRDKMTEDGYEALRLKSLIGYSAVGKIPAMIARACQDGRIRGNMTWAGAIRTRRWTSVGINLQNVKRPTAISAEKGYERLCRGATLQDIRLFWRSPMELLASVVRNFIEIPGQVILDADFSNIEGRVGAFLVGQEELLQSFREDLDAYIVIAASLYNMKYGDIEKTSMERFVGKETFLSCIFQTGAEKLWNTCAKRGKPISKEMASKAVKSFRKSYPEFPAAWNSYQEAAGKAIRNPGKWFDATEYVSFKYEKDAVFPMLIMTLPSGGTRIFPEPKVKTTMKRHKDFLTGEVSEFESDDITFYDNINGEAWGRSPAYGGKLFQLSTQSTARDIMAHGVLQAEKRGYEPFLLVHDQALAHKGDPKGFIEALCTLPDWLPSDFPLAATGGLVKRYSKD